MKKLLALLVFISCFNCKENPKNYVELSGKIENMVPSKELIISTDNGYKKSIAINEDGTYSDTLNVNEGLHWFVYEDVYTEVYLKNGYITTVNADYSDFWNTLSVEGDGAPIFNLSEDAYTLQAKYHADLRDNPDLSVYETLSSSYRKDYVELLESKGIIDSMQIVALNNRLEKDIVYRKTQVEEKIQLTKELPKGMPSPKFENYENFEGGISALDDFKGQYVYVDFWATWCGPCIDELPAMKILEEKYKGKNIAFIGISMDSPRYYGGDAAAANKAWRAFVEKENLGGVQLLTDKGFASDFLKGYKINYIPRYLIIDTSGNIVSPDAPRPSNPKLLEIFEELNI